MIVFDREFAISNDRSGGACPAAVSAPPLTRIFTRRHIHCVDSAADKPSVIRQLVRPLAKQREIDRLVAEHISRQLIQRESHASSALGRGLAFPSLRTREVDSVLGAIGVASAGVDFDAIDGCPTKLIFLTLSPIDWREQHSALLSRLLSLVQDKTLRMLLLRAAGPDDIYHYLADLDGEFVSCIPSADFFTKERSDG